jgi:hypothetical protein
MMLFRSVIACLVLPVVVASFATKPRAAETMGSRTVSSFQNAPLDPEPLAIVPKENLLGFSHPMCLLSIGMFFGYTTFLPNLMINDPGTRWSLICAHVGVCASALFCAAGIVGAVTKKTRLFICFFIFACGVQGLALWLLGS